MGYVDSMLNNMVILFVSENRTHQLDIPPCGDSRQ
jgi:hypothetical protein